ncbi:hypothetical protein TRVA0_002S02652 [Trichomonascus vanleenenianus]|uniref:Vrl1p n=1 Tax=Trichomonascus vanleenenianus TaxID=2268995 RepID=UPI003EC9E01E
MPSKEVSPTISSKYQLVEIAKAPEKNGSDTSFTQAPEFEAILANYPSLSRQLFGPLNLIIDNLDKPPAESEEDLLAALDRAVENAIQVFQSCDSREISAMALEHNLTGEDIANLLHEYVEANAYDVIWEKLTKFRAKRDLQCLKSIDKIRSVDISQIGLPSFIPENEVLSLTAVVAEATEELDRLSESKGTEEKIEVLLNVMKILGQDNSINLKSSPLLNSSGTTNGSTTFATTSGMGNGTIIPSGRSHLSADSLISLMLLVISRSKVQHPDSELNYLKNYTFRSTDSGQLGYALMTYEVVLYHILNESDGLADLSRSNEKMWELIKSHGNLQEFIDELCKDELLNWKSVLKSRTRYGESGLMQAIKARNYDAFDTLLKQDDVITLEFILSDRNEQGTTLLVAAVEARDEKLIRRILDVIESADYAEKRHYLALCDSFDRSLGHYLFYAPWLIDEVGMLVDWTKKDHNGQTPLFSLLRSYDHPEYDKMVTRALDVWKEQLQNDPRYSKDAPVMNILDHVDNRGNTLLHIAKDRKTLEKILAYDADVNWPNAKGLTPLMIYCKFSRMDAMKLITQNPLIDLERTENRGLTVLELAKDIEALSLLDEMLLFNTSPVNNKYALITRTVVFDNDLQFFIKTGEYDPETKKPTVTATVRRTFQDFVFLQKWLTYENPYTWIPILRSPRNPFAIPLKPSRQVIYETRVRLNMFLRILLAHPTFAAHELLWEFLLIQDLEKQQVIDRCRGKLESRKELQYEDITVYNSGDLELIKIFFDHASEETSRVSGSVNRLAKSVLAMMNKTYDYFEAHEIFWEKLRDIPFLVCPGINSPSDVESTNDIELTFSVQDKTLSRFSYNVSGMASTARSVVTSLAQPMGLIYQLEAQESAFQKLKEALEKLNNKSSWPMGMFEEKKERSVKETQDKIYICQSEIQRLSSDIKAAHIASASELGGFYQVQEQELRTILKDFTEGMIKSQKERLQRLTRLQDKFKRFASEV